MGSALENVDQLRVVYSFPDTLGKPGIGTTALNEARGLAGLGVRVIVCCTHCAEDVPGAVDVIETLTVRGRRLPHRALGIERAYRHHDLRVARALERSRATPPHIVHGWPLGSRATLEVAARRGIASIREAPNAHTAVAYERVARESQALGLATPRGHSHTFNAARLERENAELAAARAILVPSEHVAATFRDRGFSAERLVVNRYGFDPERFPDPGPPPAPDPRRGIRGAFVGRAEPRKGLHMGLRAWLDSGAAERGSLVICGSFTPGYREVLEPLLAHPSVEVRGFVEDPAAVLRDADFLLLPSVEEGSALVTYEAQASACALVVSAEAGALADHMDTGLIHAAGDVETLTSHIRLLDRDRPLLQRMQARACARRPELTWTAAAEGLLGIYRALMDPRGARP